MLQGAQTQCSVTISRGMEWGDGEVQDGGDICISMADPY